MNRMIFAAAAAAAVVAASPAAAQTAPASAFSGVRVGANIGVAGDKVFSTDTVTYGAEAGYDAKVGGALIGVSAEVQDSKDTGRDLALTGRVGVEASPTLLLYGLGGYTNLKAAGAKFDGYRIGGGAELAAGRNAFVKLEQRYSNYEAGLDAHQTVLGAGLRF